MYCNIAALWLHHSFICRNFRVIIDYVKLLQLSSHTSHKVKLTYKENTDYTETFGPQIIHTVHFLKTVAVRFVQNHTEAFLSPDIPFSPEAVLFLRPIFEPQVTFRQRKPLSYPNFYMKHVSEP
jgi:hypothetical protein